MSLEPPPRLKQGELGDILRAADQITVTPERIASNAAGVKALIAAGATTALWKLLLPFALLLAIAIPVALRVTSGGAPTTAAPLVIAVTPIDAITPDLMIAYEPNVIASAPVAPVEPVVAHKHVAIVASAPDANVVAAPPSTLPEELRIYEAAKLEAQHGQLALGISLIDDLLQRFPSTQLRPDAELTRAELLARADRYDEATRALEALASDAVHRGRRGELLRTLGDLYRRNKDCAHAADAYTRALAEHLSDRDRTDVERGRDLCTIQR